jgi:integrase
MARIVKPLTDSKVRNAKPSPKEYNLADGNGLHLRVKPNGSKTWIYNYKRPHDGKRTNLGLGVYPSVSLINARALRDKCREQISLGANPKSTSNQKVKGIDTFGRVFSDWYEVKKSHVSDNYAEDIKNSVTRHLIKPLGNLSVSEITAVCAIDAIQPLANRGALETVRRLCQRLNQIMDFAVNTGRLEINPLTRISSAFKSPSLVNLPSITPEELGPFLHALYKANLRVTTRKLILWQLHTMVRPSEASGAEWNEIDFEKKLWIIPAARMKKRKSHSIPLSEEALQIINSMIPISGHRTHIFVSERDPRQPMNSQSANMAIKRMGYEGKLVAHGMRSLASTALNEQGFDPQIIEKALAHEDRNSVRAAYNRAEYIEERRTMMNWWSKLINSNLPDTSTI